MVTKRPREKMSREKRAKQFIPFSALKGFDEALRRKEWEMEQKQRLKDKIWQIEKDPPGGGSDEGVT